MTAEDRASVRVSGTGRAGRPADLAQAAFVAEAIRERAAEARSAAAVIAESVIAALYGAGIAAADVPVLPGRIEVSVTVTAEWALLPVGLV